MSILRLLLCLLLVASSVSAPAQRGGRGRGENWSPRAERNAAWQGRRMGRLKPIRQIERRVVPQMRGAEYLGFDFDGSAVYTLKFLRDGHVIWVDVDGRTGATLGRARR